MTQKMLNFRGTWRTFLSILESDMTQIWSWETFGGICASNMTRQCTVSVVHDEHIFRNQFVWHDTYLVMTNVFKSLWVWHDTYMVMTNVFRSLWVWLDTYMVMTNILWVWKTTFICSISNEHLCPVRNIKIWIFSM